MICSSSPLWALSRPIPHLASLKGRALVGRGFIFQMRFAHGSATKKEGGEIALSFPTIQRLQILALERFCGVRQVSPCRTLGSGTTGDLRGVGSGRAD
jgi:hypothetical protein